LAWDIAAYNVTVPIGGSFDDALPGWGTGALQACVTGLAISSTVIVQPAGLEPDVGTLPGDVALNRTQITLAADSLVDVTERVGSDGRLSIDFSNSNGTGVNHTIFAIYLIHSDYRAQDGPLDLGGPQTAPESFRQNGSWSVDHFSTLGAETTANYWSQYILNDTAVDLLKQVGRYAWEDSVEIEANVFWTKNFTQKFETDHNYSLTKWLPILFHQNGHNKNANPAVWWVTDEDDAGNGHIAGAQHSQHKHELLYLPR
jgi:hypothetical protein